MMQIAGNSQRTGNKNRGYAESWTSEQLDGLLSEDWLRKMVADIRGGDEKQKDLLPYICPHYSAFRNNHRAQKDILPETFTHMTCVDVDDKELVEEAVKQALAINEDEYSDWQEQVLRIAYSARKKVHVYIRIPKGMTIEEAQQAFCKEIGVPYDESCITPERFIYITGKDEEIYRSAHWLEQLSDEELAERKEAYLMRGLDVDGRPLKKGESQPSNITHQPSDNTPQPSTEQATSVSLEAFDLCVGLAGLKADEMDVWGVHNWHANLMAVLSVGVAKLMSREQLRAVVAQRLPNYSQTEDCQKLIDYFYEKYDANKGFMNTALREINAKAQQKTSEKCTIGSVPLCTFEPPEMPKKLPKLIELLTSKTPEVYKAAVAHAIFPPLATHLCGVSFEYTDHVVHEATLMNCLMAETGAGKGCIDEPIRHIMADIKRRDKENERREAEWKKDCQKKGANKDKLARPEGLIIQVIDPDMTKPALVTRMDEAEGHFVYVKLNELDLFEQLKGQTGKQHFQLMCLAFDPGAEYGQTRVGTQSVTARPQCRFNWNACTTILKGRRFFRKVLTDGPISRINFCTIPEQEIGGEQPIYGKYDVEFDESLKPYIDNLVAARGLTDCQQAYKLAKRLQQECAEFAQLSQNTVYWNLSHRACVIAWLKACVLYVANGGKWEKSIEEFIRWSLNYDLWCKMAFFGADIRKAEGEDDSRLGTRGPRSLLALLPDEFTLEDAKRVRRQEGLSNEGKACQNMIRQWVFRKHVLQITDYSFIKSDKYKNK